MASVRIVAADTGEIHNITTSSAGEFDMTGLVPGRYSLEVSAAGFAHAASTIALSEGSTVQRNFALAPESEVRSLPNLTRDPFRFAQLTGSASDAGLGTRGAGLALNGQRESSTNILVDGADSRDEFTGSIGKPLPIDSVRSFTVVTSSLPAEYGRASGGVVKAEGMRGADAFHTTLYEFNRISSLTSNSFLSNANGTRQSGFRRNQFGGATGGPILRNKLYFFANTEVTLVRSRSTRFAWVPTPQLLAETAANTQTFFRQLGQLRPDAQTLGTVSIAQLTALNGRSPCLGLLCARLPVNIPLLSHVAYSAPGDAGGGYPQNTWNSYNRLDYQASDRLRIYGRYQNFGERGQQGSLSSSPYADYDLRQTQTINSGLISATHEWNTRWLSETTVAYDRLTIQQQGLTSRGVVPTMYANPGAPVTIGADAVVFPGYNPFSPGSGGAFGGPENILQLRHNTSWNRAKHEIRFGGTYFYIQDNRTDASYQTAVASLSNTPGLGGALVGMLFGTFAQMQVAVDPQGQLPCGTVPTCSLRLPVTSPNFSRSNRFRDTALYVQDNWRPMRRLAINLGVRWDYFGVQHNGNRKLDSNWFAPLVGDADRDLFNYLLLGGLQPATDGLYRPDRNNFAPRIGVSWDVTGDGRTNVRAGYGIAFDRDFGNVTFNVIQNLPNHVVLSVPGPITTNNFGPLGNATGSTQLPQPGARIINPYLKTAYAHVWDFSARREISRSIIYNFLYSGSKGVDLYSVSYPNQRGFRNFIYGDFCTGVGNDCRTSPNPYYSPEIGYRGNQGFSRYTGIENRLSINNLFHSGIVLTASHTWSHATDNLSSTFFEAGGRGIANRFGDRNITVNNGSFVRGLLDPYKPGLDEGDADFDVLHRVVVSGVWSIPAWKKRTRWGAFLDGWKMAPIFIARSGQPFSIFDSTAQTLDFSAPRATFTQSVATKPNTFRASPVPNTFHLFTFLPAQISHQPNLLTPTSAWPANMTKRNAFRAPGFWSADVAVYKDTRLGESMTVQLRAEFFNVFNHANLYVIGNSADVGTGNTVDGCFGCSGSSYDRRQIQLAARIRF